MVLRPLIRNNLDRFQCLPDLLSGTKNRKKPIKFLHLRVKKKIKNKLSGMALKDELENACEGLFFISETDAAIEPVIIANKGKKTLAAIVENLASSSEKDIENHPPDDFFGRLIQRRDWHGESEKEKVRKFKELKDLLEFNLTGLTLFRVGRIRIEIFVLGFDAEGNAAGIMTKAVET